MVRDPADIESQRRAESEIEAATIGMEVAVLVIIARRLAKITPDTPLVEIYASMPKDLSDIQAALKDGTANIQKATEEVMQRMAKANDEWARRYYEYTGVVQEPALEHAQMKETLDRKTSAAIRSTEVLCRSSVVEIINEGTKEVLPIEQAYRQTITRAATSMSTGAKSVDDAIAKAVKSLAQSGLRVIYASGATRNLYSAVSTNVMDSYRVAMSEMREIQGKEFGADGVEVSAHALCAKDHQDYQGHQYSYERKRGYRLWNEVQYEPARPLVVGANCGHTVSPVILGISEPAYSRKELQDLKRRSNENVSFTGLSGKTLTMSRYEASQYQRQLETKIRKAKENTYLLKEANLTNFAKMERATARAYSAQYKRISEEIGLRTRPDRTRAYVQK